MDKNEKNQEFSLEEIMREFGSEPTAQDSGNPELPPVMPEVDGAEAEAPEAAAGEDLEQTRIIPALDLGDTIRLDALSPELPVRDLSLEETKVLPDLSGGILPEEAQELPPVEEAFEVRPPENYTFTPADIPAPKPIPFRSRLSELKRKLVAGPEKRYYDLTEIGLGRVQMAILLNLLIVALCAGGTALYAMGMVPENRLRLMVFSQILAMMLSALLGCYALMDGITDLFTGKFSLNSMLFLTLAACAADAVFCLRELRVPCCAAFCLEMTFALWNRCLRRSTEMGQMDTLRKASRLDGIVKAPDYPTGSPAIVRTEGRVEDFMDHYSARTGPEKALNIYALLSVLACIGIAVLAGLRHDLSLAIQVFSTSMLVAVPAGAFVSQSRPAAILERRLHMVGTVLCGWKGVKSLCGKAAFPLLDKDIFPLGSLKLNGVKFLGDREPEEVISCAAALTRERGGNLEPVFTQLLKTRGGNACSATEFFVFDGGIGGVVRGKTCLLGLSEYLKAQGIEIPEGAQISNAVYFAMDGELAAVFAMNYSRTRASAGGLVTLSAHRKLRPLILCRNFMITPQLLKATFGIRTKRYDFPAAQTRDALAEFVPDPALLAGALTTQQNLSSAAYAVSGSRALRSSSRAGLVLHLFAGIVGLLIMAALAYLGDLHLLRPINILLYQLVWLVPGLLITEWARTV